MSLCLLSQPLAAVTPTIEYREPSEMAFIQNNSLIAFASPNNPVRPVILGSLTGQEDPDSLQKEYREFLKNELLLAGKTNRDFLILKEVFWCESRWQQFDKNGKPTAYKGNYGIAQINKLAHEKTYTEMGLDVVNNPFDNLTFAIFLYKNYGLQPWLAWSGSCFLPRIAGL